MEIYLEINVEILMYKILEINIYYPIVKNIFNGNCVQKERRGKK